MKTLEIKDLYVSVEGKQILKGVTLTVKQGAVHALMGPNGAGKSTLSYVIAGHPKYKVDSGSILLDGEDVLAMTPDVRAKKGVFLAFQNPLEIPGVGLQHFLYTTYKQRNPDATPTLFRTALADALAKVNGDQAFVQRQLNVGFSGGEKKRAEVLQLLLLKPAFALLDETDSGLDVDSLATISRAIEALRSPQFGCLLITHYNKMLQNIKPDVVHVLVDGKVAVTGDYSVAQRIEKEGYAWLEQRSTEQVALSH